MSDDRVIQLISANFVPLALRLSTIDGAKNETGKFWRSVFRQRPNYQGLWLVGPDGKVLSASMSYEAEWSAYFKWTAKVLAALNLGMDKFGPIVPRRVRGGASLPYWGIGVRPDGGVTLAVIDRAYNTPDRPRQLRVSDFRETCPDHVNLSAAEWSALAPPDVSVASRWTIPTAVGRKFFPLLGHMSSTFHHHEDVTDVRFTGGVASVRDGIANLVFGGSITGMLERKKTGQRLDTRTKIIGGVGSYDIGAGQMLSLTWVFDAEYRDFHDPAAHVTPLRFGTVVAWRRGGPQSFADVKPEALKGKLGSKPSR
ncbi:MAG: hypothetical protein ACLQIB_32320 [Isosphaeraceae bacterium]